MFKSNTPKPQEPPPPPRTDKLAGEAQGFKRRVRGGSGIVSSFIGGSAGEPGQVGKLGLVGRG